MWSNFDQTKGAIMNIRTLPDKWRSDEDENGQEFAPWLNGLACAKELEAALPKWTKITDDPDTWPPVMNENLPIEGMFVAQPECTADHEYTPTFTWFDEDDMISAGDWIGTWWRPLCDLDYPPEDSK